MEKYIITGMLASIAIAATTAQLFSSGLKKRRGAVIAADILVVILILAIGYLRNFIDAIYSRLGIVIVFVVYMAAKLIITEIVYYYAQEGG